MTSVFRSRRRQQEPPSSIGFDYTRRREPVDPPCTLEREEQQPEIQLAEHQLDLLKNNNNKSNALQVVATQDEAQAPNHVKEEFEPEVSVLYDDENEVVVDENEAAAVSHSVPRHNVVEEVKEVKEAAAPNKSLTSRAMMRAMKRETLASKASRNNVATSSQQSSNRPSQKPFSTRSNQNSGPAVTKPTSSEPPPAQTSSKKLALASLMSRSGPGARNSVFKKNGKTTSGQEGVASSSNRTATSMETNTTNSRSTGASGNGSVVSSVTAASEQDKAVLRQMLLGNASTDKTSFSTKAPTTAKQPVMPNATSTASSATSKSATSSEVDSKDFLRGYLKSHRASSKAASTTSSKPTNSNASAASSTSLFSKKSSKQDKSRDDVADEAPIIKSKSGSSSGGASDSSKSKTTNSSSSGQHALLRKVLSKTLAKASSKDNNKERRKLSPRGKLTKDSSKSSPKSDGSSSAMNSSKSLSDSASDNISERDSRLESAAVSLSRNVLRSTTSKTNSPRGYGNNFKGYLKNKMSRSKKPGPLCKSNPVSDPSDNNMLAPSSSADSADTLKAESFKSVDETVDETIDSTVDLYNKGSQLQSMKGPPATSSDTTYDDDIAKQTLTTSSTLSEDSSNISFGPIPPSTNLAQTVADKHHINSTATIDTEESSAIMINLQSVSTDSMQYSTEESCEGVGYIVKAPSFNSDNLPHDVNESQHMQLVASSTDEPEGYTKFVQALRAEASGAHSQLWSSFQAVMTGSSRRAPPKQDRGAHFRFDPATRKMLADMNTHLKKQALVECVTATQLVNDKKFAKEAAVGLALRASKAGSSPRYGQIREHGTMAASSGAKNAESSSTVSSKVFTEQLPNLREMQPLMDGDENTPTNERQMASQQDSVEISESTSSVEITLGQFETQAASQEGPPSRQYSTSSDTVEEDVPAKTTTAVKAAQGKITLGTRRAHQPPPLPESEPELPWVKVRLRSVAQTNEASEDRSKTTEQSQIPAMPSPWAKVKLRRVSAADENVPNQDEEEAPGEVHSQGNPAPFEPEIIVCPSHLSDLEDRSNLKSSEPEIIKCHSQLSDPGENSKHSSSKEQHSVPKKGTTEESATMESTRVKIDESAVVFTLKQTSDSSKRGVEKVVIGKKMVMGLRSQPDEDDDRALVTWKYPRERIKGLKADMESQSVNLSLDHGEPQILEFNDFADCLKFTNAFYEHQHLQLDISDLSKHMQQLNLEEQKVLETYRQVRRTKAPDDAMRAIVAPAPILNDEEVTIAEKYRKMLKDSIPVNDVRARMQLDGVSVAVENFILSSVNERKDSHHSTDYNELPLSDEEAKVAASYQKMLKLKIPPEAVQHKMTKEGVDPKIMGFVLGQAGMLATDTNYPEDLSQSERKVATLYSNMLKMMVPPDSVRKKMKEDNVDEKIVFAVLGQDKVEKKTLEDTAMKLSEAEEAIAASYRKMLKMMIPKEAVKHKMIKDQVDPKIMVVVVGSEIPNSSLTDKEEAIAATYRKLLKLQLPKEAVRHRMEKEGVSEKIMKAVLGSDASSSKSNDKSSSAKTKSSDSNNKVGSNLVSLHWTPLSGEELDNSVWRATKKRKVAKAPEESEFAKLVELFQKKNNIKAVKGKSSDTGKSGTGKANLLDINRANNVAISLKAFKDFSFDELAEVLKNIDPYGKLKGERVQFVRDLLPTPAETNIFKNFFGVSDRLGPAEKWFHKIVHIKRLEEKAHVLHTMEVFDVEVAELRENLQLLAQVCSQVMESERLRELLDMVLQIGNIMNEGTRTGGAAGFKFDSLLRLTQTKSGDGKTTVLDYMVTIYAAKGQRQVLNLTEDFPDCQAASRILITDLVANVRTIGDTLQKCKKEHKALLSDMTGKVASTAAHFQGKSSRANQETASDTRLQMLSAISSRGVKDPRNTSSEASAPNKGSSMFLKKDSILDAIKAKGMETDADAPSSSEAPAVNDLLKALTKANGPVEGNRKSPRNSLIASQHGKEETTKKESNEVSKNDSAAPSDLQRGINRLEKFINEADKKYQVLKTDCDSALKTCREMSQYCGESGGERSADSLLGILSEFASTLEAAVKKHDRIMAAESKKKQNKQPSETSKKQRRRPEDLHFQSSPKTTKSLEDHSKQEVIPVKTSPKRKPLPEAASLSSKPLLPPAPPGQNGKSLVLMVNQMLKGADEQTKKDFSQGVVYEDADLSLKEIYEREKRAMARSSSGVPPLPSGRRSIDGDILTTIKKRQGETDANVARENRSQLERFIGSMNCNTSGAESDAESVKTESSQLDDSFKDLQSKWSQYKSSSPSVVSTSSMQSDQNQDDDEGSVHLPIDLTSAEEEAQSGSSSDPKATTASNSKDDSATAETSVQKTIENSESSSATLDSKR